MVITKISNLHIHNSNSQCCWNRYPIKILYQEAKRANLKYVGTTNHISPPVYPTEERPEDIFQQHIIWTKEEIDSLAIDINSKDGNNIPIYLGAELDIKDDSGKHFILPKYEKMLDYFIAGMHSYFNMEVIKDMYTSPDKEEFLDDYFEEWGNWAVNYINISRPNIFVHPFWQELQFGLFYEKKMMETAQRIFEAAADKGTAIECSSLQIRTRRPMKPFWLSNDPRGDHVKYFMKFYTNMYKLAKECGSMVAFGSDAHQVSDIKDVITIKNLLEEVGYEDEDIYEPIKK